MPGAKITKRADLGLKTLFCTNSCTLLKRAKKCCTQCENKKNVVISRWKRLFVQTCVLCWKSLRSGQPNAKMTRRADLGLKMLFCANSRTLLKTGNKWWTQCKNDETCWSPDENAVLYKLVHFAENHRNVERPVLKWQNVVILDWKRCFVLYTNVCTLLRITQNWCNQWENNKTCWSRVGNAVLHKPCTLLQMA